MCKSFLAIVGDDNAFASSEPVILHYPDGAKVVEGFVDDGIRGGCHAFRVGGNDLRVGGAHPGSLHDVLGEGLGTFDAGSVLVGAENIESGVAESVGDTAYQRRFRPDNNEVGLDFLGECHTATAGGFHHRVASDRGRGAGGRRVSSRIAVSNVDFGNLRVPG